MRFRLCVFVYAFSFMRFRLCGDYLLIEGEAYDKAR